MTAHGAPFQGSKTVSNWTALRVVAVSMVSCLLLLLHWFGGVPGIHGDLQPRRTHPRAAAQADTPADPPASFGVVFDAGSTGTRVHIFGFDSRRNALWEKFHSHDYTLGKDPAALCFDGLLQHVRNEVPTNKLSTTRAVLGATAGLRKLGKDKASEALKSAEAHIESCGLNLASAAILTGEEEGVYAWVTVNYLLGNFNPRTPPSQLTGIIDCGGGSVQVVFSEPPQEKRSLARTIEVLGQSHSLSVHSAMGYGLNDALAKAGGGAGCSGFEGCAASVGAVLDGLPIPTVPRSMHGSGVYAFSFFHKMFGGVRSTVGQLQKDAASRCVKSPRDCAAYAYLSHLPTKLGLEPTTAFSIAKKLPHGDGVMETAWPLGAYLSLSGVRV